MSVLAFPHAFQVEMTRGVGSNRAYRSGYLSGAAASRKGKHAHKADFGSIYAEEKREEGEKKN
jgi:hypothetical protein